MTWGKPVVAGRTTYLSFTKKPLPGRTNIVVSRNRSFAAPGALVAASVEAALEAARGDALRRGVGEIAVIGGADIYAQTMSLADRLVITRVHLQPDGDTTFPVIDPDIWQEAERTEHRAGPDDEAPLRRRSIVVRAGDPGLDRGAASAATLKSARAGHSP